MANSQNLDGVIGLLVSHICIWLDTVWAVKLRWLCKLDSNYKSQVFRDYIHSMTCTSAKTKSPSLNIFSLLYLQTQKKEIKFSLKYGIALLFQSVLWVIMMPHASITTSVSTVVNVTTSTWWIVPISFGVIQNDLMVNSVITHFNLSLRWWLYSLHMVNHACSSCFYRPSWHNLSNDIYHAEVVHNI
jgi:hypothetical protein